MTLIFTNILRITTLSALTLLTTNVLNASQYNDGKKYSYDHKYPNAVFRIEIHNKTETQWFSPYLCALHHKRLNLFQEDKAASTGLATFAEDGFPGVLAKELRENPYVYTVLQSGPGLIPPDATLTTYIKGPSKARLTCAAMPVTTNDVLTVVQGVKTPKHINYSFYYSSTEWDLGSERNNYSSSSMPEDSANLVPEGANNPVTISNKVMFGSAGRPTGVPSLLSPFTRAYLGNNGKVASEGTMSVFESYKGSQEFPTEIYGWNDSASQFSVTRIE